MSEILKFDVKICLCLFAELATMTKSIGTVPYEWDTHSCLMYTRLFPRRFHPHDVAGDVIIPFGLTTTGFTRWQRLGTVRSKC